MNDRRQTTTVDRDVDDTSRAEEAIELGAPGLTPETEDRHATTEDIARAQAATTSPVTGTTEARTSTPTAISEDESATPLFDKRATSDLRDRWDDIQTGFVDEPRSSVEKADALVAEVMKQLADSFATERRSLEGQWSRGDDVSTEDLRVALRRYRSFFDRLLEV